MNGMKRKAARRRLERRFKDGIPIDPSEWTEDDWRDLNNAIEWVKERIRRRHAHEDR